MTKEKTPKLEIAESLQEDIDKGIARIPSNILDELKLVSGDLIELTGKNKVIVRALRAAKRDSTRNIIRIDGTIRANLGASIGDSIAISPIKVKAAQSMTLSPLQEVRFSDDPTEYFHTKLLDIPIREGQKIVIDVFGTRLAYIVSKTNPKENVIIKPSTKIIVSETVHSGEGKSTGITYEDIGGLKNEIELIREMVELPMKHPEVFQKLGVGAPKGVLLTGPPGTGKTLLAKAVATETDSTFYSIAGPEIISKYYGESEKHLRDVFEKAEKTAPSIIFIDEIDSIAPKRGEGIDQTEKRVVAQLLTLMDGLKSRGQVVVMAATNRPDDIDEALRRPGRFDRELRINPPDEEGRKEILRIHTRGMPLEKDVDFNEISYRTIGFTGADIEVLCKEAALKSIKPYFSELKTLQEKVPTNILEKIKVSRQHFLEALKRVEPSAMREVLIQKPHVSWDDVGGLDKEKEKLREVVELPLLRPDLFVKAGIKPAKGVLISGPSGTGKTLLAKAVATETNANFISIKGPELVSKWVGESEKHIRDIFKKAKQVSPSIIFFDEFDSISQHRGIGINDSTERMVNQLLTELDGVEELERVVIIAATNRKDLLDPALIRSGRIDVSVELSIPNLESRKKIFSVHTKSMPLDKNINLEDYAKKTEGWTGADLSSITREAGIIAIKRAYKGREKEIIISRNDFDIALENVSKSIGKPIKNKEIDVKSKTTKIKIEK
ncbi:CDC48 family AAA ATPase [Candidatus Pacearchaeota archaeon]|nr:CDC48 family AAA ATPase [Candidatus Pacearchaeota archaeon]